MVCSISVRAVAKSVPPKLLLPSGTVGTAAVSTASMRVRKTASMPPSTPVDPADMAIRPTTTAATAIATSTQTVRPSALPVTGFSTESAARLNLDNTAIGAASTAKNTADSAKEPVSTATVMAPETTASGKKLLPRPKTTIASGSGESIAPTTTPIAD